MLREPENYDSGTGPKEFKVFKKSKYSRKGR